MHPRPQQRPHPPLWIHAPAASAATQWIGGGSSFESVDLAARLGLPLMLPSVLAAPPAFVAFVARYRERFVANGPGRDRPRVGACSHVHVATDSQAARARWRPHHLSYLTWVTTVLMPWGGVNIGFTPRAGEAQAPAAPPPQPPDFDALCRGPSICGSPAEVADRIASMRELLGLELHLAMFDHGGIPDAALADTLELFAAKVIPQVTAG